jgi:eukaryotic-like serine/threonine-protein kinase
MEGQVFLSRYEAIRLLGEGGMGKVYLARQRDVGREVVVKVMHEHLAADQRFRKNFLRENLMMARFQHRHAVALLDAATESEGQLCIVMEYVQGTSLETLVKREGRLEPLRVGRLLGQLCSVLQAAHDQGILHRDITAANVMIVGAGSPQESLKVMDFGLARLGGGPQPYIALEKLTGTGQSIGGGTPDYVCPEQIRGESVDLRGDLYSVGVLLFLLLTGHLPFEHAASVGEILLCHLDQQPPSFAAVGAGDKVNHAVEEVVQACLAKFPVERPQTARELGERFENALGQKILDDDQTVAPAPATAQRRINPHELVDVVEAWMPESIAVVKLRGFVGDFGGEVVDSEPGLIRVVLPAPGPPAEPAKPAGLLGWLGLAKKPAANSNRAVMELHMETKPGARSHLVISVTLRPEKPEPPVDPKEWKAWTDDTVRELRAYLIGR